MIPNALALLAVAAHLTLVIEDARDVSAREVNSILAHLSVAVERRIGDAPAAQPYLPGEECLQKDRCAATIREITGAPDILFLRIFAVPSKLRVYAELVDLTSQERKRALLDLSRDPRNWSFSMDALATALFPNAVAAGARHQGAQSSTIAKLSGRDDAE